MSNYLEDIFDDAGCPQIYEKHRYKFGISGILESVDRDLMESFLDTYSFEEAEEVYYDEFIYHFRTFQSVYERNEDIPIRPW